MGGLGRCGRRGNTTSENMGTWWDYRDAFNEWGGWEESGRDGDGDGDSDMGYARRFLDGLVAQMKIGCQWFCPILSCEPSHGHEPWADYKHTPVE